MKLRLLVFALLAVSSLGCAHGKSDSKSDAPDISSDVDSIRKRAALDLNCTESIKVDVVEEGNMWRPWTFAATGCGQHATYLSRMGTIMRN